MSDEDPNDSPNLPSAPEFGTLDPFVFDATTSAPPYEPLAGAPLGGRKHLYTNEILSFWNLRKVFKYLGTRDQCISFAISRGLISATRICPQHEKPMTIDNQSQLGTYRCRKSNCRTKPISRARGTMFEDLHLPLSTVFEIMYCFCNNFGYDQAQRECCADNKETAVSSKTICDWYSFCREAIIVHYVKHQNESEMIGGPSKTVLLDKVKIGKRKLNKGKEIGGHWVIIMREVATGELRLEVCQDCESAEVLLPMLKKHVTKGSLIQTDLHQMYECIKENEYTLITKENGASENISSVATEWAEAWSTENQACFQKDKIPDLIESAWKKDVKSKLIDPFEELMKCIVYVNKIDDN